MSDSGLRGPRTANGSRAPLLHPEELDPEQKVLYDSIAGGPRAASRRTIPLTDNQGRLIGPFGIALFAPRIGSAVQQVGASIRYGGELSDRVRELCILAVAAHQGSEFEWWAHENAARELDFSDQQLAELRIGHDPSGLDELESSTLAIVRSLIRRRSLTDDEYERATTTLNRSGLSELVWLVAYYEGLALALDVFDLPNPLKDGTTQ